MNLFGQRHRSTRSARGRLDDEAVVWLATVGVDGRPHLVPTWFSRDGDVLWIFSKPGAVKVRNVRRERRVRLALGDALDDFDVQLIDAVAELPEAAPEPVAQRHRRKYARRLRNLAIGWDEYLATYSQPMRIRPVRYLAWHGRGPSWQAPAAPRLMPALA